MCLTGLRSLGFGFGLSRFGLCACVLVGIVCLIGFYIALHYITVHCITLHNIIPCYLVFMLGLNPSIDHILYVALYCTVLYVNRNTYHAVHYVMT